MNAMLSCPEPSAIPPSALPSMSARMLDYGAVALLLTLSVRKVKQMNAAGEMPSPTRFGRAVRWDALELNEWLSRRKPDGNLPSRKEWAVIRTSRGR